MLLDGPEVDQLSLGSTRSGQSALVVPVTLGEEMQAFIYFSCIGYKWPGFTSEKRVCAAGIPFS